MLHMLFCLLSQLPPFPRVYLKTRFCWVLAAHTHWDSLHQYPLLDLEPQTQDELNAGRKSQRPRASSLGWRMCTLNYFMKQQTMCIRSSCSEISCCMRVEPGPRGHWGRVPVLPRQVWTSGKNNTPAPSDWDVDRWAHRVMHTPRITELHLRPPGCCQPWLWQERAETGRQGKRAALGY
jgi:hypothetical protein